MKMRIENKMLYPNCSEYVTRIKFTKEELKEAIKLAKRFKFDKEDMKIFKEELEDGEDEPRNSFGQFINEEFEKPYIFIRETILENRKEENKNEK